MLGRITRPVRIAASELERIPTAWLPLAAEVELDDGLTLAEAGTIALSYAPDVVQARTDARIKGAQLLQAGRLGDVEFFVGPRLGLEDAGFVFPGSVSWQVPLGDELGAERGRATAGLQTAKLGVMAVELDTLVAVRERYIEIAALQSQLATQRKAMEEASALLDYVERLRKAGEADPVAVHLAQLERDEAEQQLEEAMRALPVRKAALLGLIGLMPSAPVEIAADESAFALPALPGPDSQHVLSHPRLQKAAAAFRTADQAARLAVAQQNPKLAIGPDFEADRGDLELGAGIGLTVPNPARQKARVAEAIERRKAARQAYRNVLLSLSREEVESRAQLSSLDRLLLSHTKRLEGAASAEKALDERTTAGLVVPIEAIAARSAIARARNREVDLLKRRATATLRAAHAGGFLLVTPGNGSQDKGSN